MLTVHHLGISQSDRVVWLCEELGIDYDLRHYARDPVTRLAPPELKALSPYGTAPVITDGDVVLGETGAIFDYILARYGDGRFTVAPDRPEYPHYLFWLHFANASMMTGDMIGVMVDMFGKADDPIGILMKGRSKLGIALVEARLGQVPYFAGDMFTAADMMMMFPLTTMRLFAPRDLGPYPNVLAYLRRIDETTGYRAALAKSDPGFEPMLS